MNDKNDETATKPQGAYDFQPFEYNAINGWIVGSAISFRCAENNGMIKI